MGPSEQSGGRCGPRRRNAQARSANRRSQPANHRNRQARLLRTDRSRYRKSLRLHERSNEPKRNGTRRPRRNRRLPGKAQTSLVRQVNGSYIFVSFFAALRMTQERTLGVGRQSRQNGRVFEQRTGFFASL